MRLLFALLLLFASTGFAKREASVLPPALTIACARSGSTAGTVTLTGTASRQVPVHTSFSGSIFRAGWISPASVSTV